MRHLALGFMGSVVLLATACGGKVVVDAGGNGGSGGSGGSVVSTGVVSPVGVVSASTGGGSLCEQLCSSLAAKGCDISQSCVADCQQAYTVIPQCASLLDAFYVCVLNSSAPGCDSPPACADESNSLALCLDNIGSGTCVDVACAGNGGGSCACKGVCDDRVLAVECTPGNATDFCTCIADGVTVGTCSVSQASMSTTCDILDGCCADVFFP